MTSPATPSPQPGDTLPAGLRDRVAVALHDADCHDSRCQGLPDGPYYRMAGIALEAAAPALRAQGAAAEREACAKLAEQFVSLDDLDGCVDCIATEAALQEVAGLIRARTTP